MSTQHDSCACDHQQPATDASLPMAGSTTATDVPGERQGCGGGGGHSSEGGCCGGHAA